MSITMHTKIKFKCSIKSFTFSNDLGTISNYFQILLLCRRMFSLLYTFVSSYLRHKSSFVLCFNQKQHSYHFPLSAIFKLAQPISTLILIFLQFLYIPQQLVYQSSSSTNYNNRIHALLSHLSELNINISTIIYLIYIIFLVTLFLFYRERFKSIIIGIASNPVFKHLCSSYNLKTPHQQW